MVRDCEKEEEKKTNKKKGVSVVSQRYLKRWVSASHSNKGEVEKEDRLEVHILSYLRRVFTTGTPMG